MKKKIVLLALAGCLTFTGSTVMATPKTTSTPAPSGLFDLYEQNRNEGISNYITTDFILLSYSMLRKQDTIILEQQVIMPALLELTMHLQKKMKDEKGVAAKANMDFVAVLSALAKGEEKVSGAADPKKAASELSLVLEAGGIAASPLWTYSMDYSQFKPRGAYTSSEQRENYFRAMRYASSVLFAVKESKAAGISAELTNRLTEQALMLARIISADKKAGTTYRKMNESLSFRFGKADDLVLPDVLAVMEKNPKDTPAARQMLFARAVSEGRQPAILSGIVDRTKLEKNETPADVLTGFRLFPQRYSSDSAFFQKLVSPKGGEYKGKKHPFGLVAINGKLLKGFPSSYELMAQYGSKAANDLITEDGEPGFGGYEKVVTAGRQELAQASGVDKLHKQVLQVFFAGAEDGEQRLETGLAFWTWQRYVNLLYTKQSMTMNAKSIAFGAKERAGAALEQAMPLYLSLSRTVGHYQDMYQNNGVNGAVQLWKQFDLLLDRCLDIASKQNLGVALNVEDNRFLNNLDKKLLVLTGGKDHPIVVDVHTEPNSKKVVEEGVGMPKLVTYENARGARLTHYEFKYDMDKRLNDSEWQDMVKANKIPKRK